MFLPGFESKPVVPAQPNREVYGVNDLMLFRCWRLPDYTAAHGVPPAFDPTYRPKPWFDSTVDLSDPEAQVGYDVVRVVKGVPGVYRVYMTAHEAARLNIPGKNDSPARPEWEFPIRALAPNETLTNTPFGVQVVRTDLRIQAEQSTGKFLPEDRALLQAIAKQLGIRV